ncbi:hypothetical protein SDC9_179064 [bioreactor metagenome]|uniref:Uncharacterized protein n=1 Tax=bioreactor metagenome TaxID=1076179 RepID=A0A645GYV2_9ZZZZ
MIKSYELQKLVQKSHGLCRINASEKLGNGYRRNNARHVVQRLDQGHPLRHICKQDCKKQAYG